MELKLDSVTDNTCYWCMFRAQTRISSAAMLKPFFVLFQGGSHASAPHDVHIPICLHIEVLRGSVSTAPTPAKPLILPPNSPTASQQANPRSLTCSMSMSTRTQMRAPALIELVFPQGDTETRCI